MAQLLVRNIPDELAKLLKLRAAEHGVSAEEEHRRILREALGEAVAVDEKTSNEERIRRLLSFSSVAEDDDGNDSLFDRIRKLGEIAPDFEFGTERLELEPREAEW
ncbi:MAG: hypothetical protein QM680_10765 [Luteolibacter sp.]